MENNVDILEDDIYKISPDLLNMLLKDHSATRAKYNLQEREEVKQVNIFWATDIYEQRYGKGNGYDYHDPITIENIIKKNGNVVQPRVNKSAEEQLKRTREKAEVFTPSWICNKQCNLIDNAWFGRENVFNNEIDLPDNTHDWLPAEGEIQFPNDPEKTWEKYVSDTRLEITCGEAPYLVSRYDTITGKYIPISKRIGILDRKLRVVSERCDDEDKWCHYALIAYQSTYGYDWQGDNVLLAREALFWTYIEYFQAKFNKKPRKDTLMSIAYIISWNIWQMDGLKFVIPDSCKKECRNDSPQIIGLEDNNPKEMRGCPGCLNSDMPELHNGIKCYIKDWTDDNVIKFSDLLK
ncbi:MAG: restriction endonuclease subunit M [Muribaculaceae bacterium]|nr:restriction endonuclease subunit M [Muribaculaceae bacterium]